MKTPMWKNKAQDRRHFVGGSDARIIMGTDEAALVRLWQEKRGEVEPQDLSGNLIVQLGVVTEDLNRRWYEANTGQVITDIQRRAQHPAIRWMAATLDGRVEGSDAVFEAKFMLPWSFSEEVAAEKYMPQLQHNMWVVNARSAVLSIIHRRRKMDRDDHSRRRPLPALSGDRRAPFLALRSDRGYPAPLRDRASAAKDRRGSHRRHERVEFLGGVRRPFLRHPFRLPRP